MSKIQLEIISDLLTRIAQTLNIIIISTRLSEATDERERAYLSQALAAAISDSSNPQNNARATAQPGMGYPQQMFQ